MHLAIPDSFVVDIHADIILKSSMAFVIVCMVIKLRTVKIPALSWVGVIAKMISVQFRNNGGTIMMW